MKRAILLAFLTIITLPAFAEDAAVATAAATNTDRKIASTAYVAGAVDAANEYTDDEILKVKLTQGSNVTITNNKINVATGTQTTAGVVKYGTIPTTSTGGGEALIWVE
jgi:hypothetical protein